MALPRLFTGYGELIMLSVADDAMTGDAIADGNSVVVRRGSDAENGDIVAAMLPSETADGCEAIVKTFRRHDSHAWLIPHNSGVLPDRGRQRRHHPEGRHRPAAAVILPPDGRTRPACRLAPPARHRTG